MIPYEGSNLAKRPFVSGVTPDLGIAVPDVSASTPLTLVLYASFPTVALSFFDDWVDHFADTPLFRTVMVDLARWDGVRRAARVVREAELIVVLNSLTSDNTGLDYLRRVLPALQSRRGRLMMFMGNEVNIPSCSMTDKLELTRQCGPEWIATMLPITAGEWLYAPCCPPSRVVAVPQGLNPAAFPPGPPLDQRPLDLGVRSEVYPVFLGENQRNQLFTLFASHPFAPPLVRDINLSGARLRRPEWAAFLARCKATVANEAGAPYLERDDATVTAIRRFAEERARAGGQRVIGSRPWMFKLGTRLPAPVQRVIKALMRRGGVGYATDIYKSLSFDEVYERFFAHRTLSPVSGKHMTSRHFDAAGTGTCQILVKGHYNGILEPGRHYIPLEPDFSNLDEAMARFHDEGERQTIADAARELVMESHTLGHRLRLVRRIIEEAP